MSVLIFEAKIAWKILYKGNNLVFVVKNFLLGKIMNLSYWNNICIGCVNTIKNAVYKIFNWL